MHIPERDDRSVGGRTKRFAAMRLSRLQDVEDEVVPAFIAQRYLVVAGLGSGSVEG